MTHTFHKFTHKTDRPTVRWAPSYLVLRNPVNIWSTETSVQYRKWNDKCPHRQGSPNTWFLRTVRRSVRVTLMKESSKKKAQLFRCTEALDGLLTKGMSLKIFLETFWILRVESQRFQWQKDQHMFWKISQKIIFQLIRKPQPIIIIFGFKTFFHPGFDLSMSAGVRVR